MAAGAVEAEAGAAWDGSADRAPLDAGALAALGGLPAIIHQYSEADTGELRRNWFCVLLEVAGGQARQVPRPARPGPLPLSAACLARAPACRPQVRMAAAQPCVHPSSRTCARPYISLAGAPRPLPHLLPRHGRAPQGGSLPVRGGGCSGAAPVGSRSTG